MSLRVSTVGICFEGARIYTYTYICPGVEVNTLLVIDIILMGCFYSANLSLI